MEKLAIARSKAVVDFALWGGVTATNAGTPGYPELNAMADEGAVGFKAFTSHSPEHPKIPDHLLAEAFRFATSRGLVTAIHSEDQELIDYYTHGLRLRGRNDALVNPDSRPAICEIEAVTRVIALGELVGARFHIAHVSHPATFDLVRAARARGVAITAETCAHYLTLTRNDVATIGALAMCNPPLRDVTACEGLWAHLGRGSIDCVATDHCAYTDEEKSNPDFWEMPAGISGIQVMFPMVVGEARRRGIDLPLLARVFSGNPARILGLFPKKGSMQPGGDADLTLVDLGGEWTVHGTEFFSKARGTAYEGMRVGCRVKRTMVRGTDVFVDDSPPGGRILTAPGSGQYVTPQESARATGGA